MSGKASKPLHKNDDLGLSFYWAGTGEGKDCLKSVLKSVTFPIRSNTTITLYIHRSKQTHPRTDIAALAKATKHLRLKSEEEDAFQNTPSSITTEVELIWPDSPPSNSKALVRKPNFVQGFCNPCLFHTLEKASLKPSFQIAVLLGFC